MSLEWLKDLAGPLISGVVAAFLVPRIQHGLWKRQRFREQQILTAREWAQFIYATEHGVVLADRYDFPTPAPAELTDILVRQEGLLAIVPILFSDKRTGAALSALNSKLEEFGPEKWFRKKQSILTQLRYKLLEAMYSEALS